MPRPKGPRFFISDATDPRYLKDGTKVTQNGIDWDERMLDEEYVRGLRGEFDYEMDPADYDDDRDYDER